LWHRLVIHAGIASATFWAPRGALLMRNATRHLRRQWGWRVFGKVFLARVALSGLRGRRIAPAAATFSLKGERLLRHGRNAQPLLHVNR
jgi:hypothetical protein